MPVDQRKKGLNWAVTDENGIFHKNGVIIALLMDLRDELVEVRNRLDVLHCQNFLNIPRKLDRIGRNTARKKRKLKVQP